MKRGNIEHHGFDHDGKSIDTRIQFFSFFSTVVASFSIPRLLSFGTMRFARPGVGFGTQCSTRPFFRTRGVWVAASQTGVDVVKVSFRCGPKPVDFGQQLAVISNLSDWTANDKAVMLEWQAGDEWTGDCTLPVGDVEFKLAAVARQSDDTVDIVEWEQCDNKVASLSPGVDAWGIQCTWDSSEIDLEQIGKKQKRKRTPKKKAEEVEDAPVTPAASAEEESSTQTGLQHIQEEEQPDMPVSGIASNVSAEEDVVMYNFDDNDDTESAADMAKRILGQ